MDTQTNKMLHIPSDTTYNQICWVLHM